MVFQQMHLDPEKHARRLAPWGAVLTLLGAAIGGWFALPLVLIGMTLLLFACVSRQDGFLLLGPIATTELVRVGRLGKRQLWRGIYALVAGLIVFLNLATSLPWSQLFGSSQIPGNELARINLAISLSFSGVLFAYVSVLTVQVMSGAIAEEREKKRWDVLLTTDLRGREILLGKLFGRMPLLLDPILASLPILAVLPLFGGVPPWLAGTTILACVSVMFSLGGIALCYSVFASSRSVARDATLGTVFLYGILSVSLTLGVTLYNLAAFPQAFWPGCPVVLEDVESVVSAGNPLSIVLSLLNKPVDIETEVPRLAWHFAIFHFAIFFLFVLMAISRLPRAVIWGSKDVTLPGTERVKTAAVQASDRDRRPTDPPRELKPEREPVKRPPVEDFSIAWWERYGWYKQPPVALTLWRFARIMLYSWIALGLFLGLEMIWPESMGTVRKDINIFLLSSLSLISFFTAVLSDKAARCVVKEREANTLDGLLLVPLSRSEILYQKWLGCFRVSLPLVFAVVAFLLPFVILGFVPVLVYIQFVVGWMFTNAVLLAFGIFFSVISRTSNDAVFRLALCLVVFAILMLFFGSIAKSQDNIQFVEAFLLPPAGFHAMQTELNLSKAVPARVPNPSNVVASWLAGMIVYGTIGLALFGLACRRFEKEREN